MSYQKKIVEINNTLNDVDHCITPAKCPPIYDVTLKDGEEIQVMELGVRDGKRQFILVDCLKKPYRMNPTDTTKGGYDACELRSKLNGEILARFPDELRAAMVPFENGDLLKLPSDEEIFGNEDGDGQFECMKDVRNRIAMCGKGGYITTYWLSAVAPSWTFGDANSSGAARDNGAAVNGVRPRFQLRE